MRFSVRLVETDKEISQMIMKIIIEWLNKRFKGAIIRIRTPIVEALEMGIKSQPEYKELDNGRLATDFGLADGKERIDAIIDHFLEKIRVEYEGMKKIGADKHYATIRVIALAQIDELINMQEAIVKNDPPPEYKGVREPDKKKGQDLRWLEWLLKGGQVLGYNIHYAPIGQGRSRSGRGVMVKSSSNWSVRQTWGSTREDDNFLTRAIDSVAVQLNDIGKQLEGIL